MPIKAGSIKLFDNGDSPAKPSGKITPGSIKLFADTPAAQKPAVAVNNPFDGQKTSTFSPFKVPAVLGMSKMETQAANPVQSILDFGKKALTTASQLRDKVIKIIEETPFTGIQAAYSPSDENLPQLTQKFETSQEGKKLKVDTLLKESAITGATGGIVKPKSIEPVGITEKVVSGVGQAVGVVTTISGITKVLNGAMATNATIASLINNYPKIAKIAVPLATNAIAFTGYGQLDPDTKNRFKKAAEDIVMSIPYTGLGLIKPAIVSIPSAAVLGFGMAKMQGATDEDAYIQAGILGALDMVGRAGNAKFQTGRASETLKPNDARATINKYSEAKINNKSTPEEIETAYKQAAHKVHPDKGGNAQDFIAVNQAYIFLKNQTVAQPAKPAQEPKTEIKQIGTGQEQSAIDLQKQFEIKLAAQKAQEKLMRSENTTPIDTANKPIGEVKKELDQASPIVSVIPADTVAQVASITSKLPNPEQIISQTPMDLQNRWATAMDNFENSIKQPLMAKIEEISRQLEEYKGKRDEASKTQIKALQGQIESINGQIAGAYGHLEQDHVNFGLALADYAVKKAQSKGLNFGEYKTPESMSDDWATFASEIIERMTERPWIETNYEESLDKIIDDYISEYTNKIEKQKEAMEPVKRIKPLAETAIKIITDGESAEKQANILMELANAEAGHRIFIRGDGGTGNVEDVVRQPSTFPDWIPDEPKGMRSKKVIDAVLNHINNDTIPTKANEVRLYNVIADRLGLIEGVKELAGENDIDVSKLFSDEKIDEQISTISGSEKSGVEREAEKGPEVSKNAAGVEEEIPENEKYEKLESESYKIATENTDALISEYEKIEGNFLGGDNIKADLFPEYDKNKTQYLAFRKAGDFLWNKIFDKWLVDKLGQGNNRTLILMGGPAVGKTTAAKAIYGKDFLDRYAFVVEVTGQDKALLDKTIGRINNSGFGADVIQIYSDIKKAFPRMLTRAQENGGLHDGKGRTVYIPEFVRRNIGAIEVGRAYSKEFNQPGGNQYDFILNEGTLDEIKLFDSKQTFDFLDKIGYNKNDEESLITQFYDKAIQSRSAGTISEDVFRGTAGLSGSERERSQAERRISSQSSQAGDQGQSENGVEKKPAILQPPVSAQPKGGFVAPDNQKGISGNADVGNFSDGTPVKMGNMDKIMPVETPELVKLVVDLTGKFPSVRKRFGRARGRFYPGTGEVKLRADIFDDPVQAAKTLAHEIGHLVDWLPDKAMERGNILGRLFTLRDFLKKTYGTNETLFGKQEGGFPDEIKQAIRNRVTKHILQRHNIKFGEWVSGKVDKNTRKVVGKEINNEARVAINDEIQKKGFIKDETIRKELWEVSTYWRPLGENPSADFLAYRKSSPELYADALSVLLNSPGILEEKAPTFYKLFFQELDNKPDVHEAYWAIQDLLHGAKEELYLARETRVKKGFLRAEDIQKGFLEKRAEAGKNLWLRLRQQLDDYNFPINKKISESESNGVIISPEDNPRHVLQELPYMQNDNYLMVEDVHDRVSQPIKDAGMNDDDMGIYLMLSRIATERANLANPYGFDVKTAGDQLDYLKQRVGEKNFDLLREKAQVFHEIVFKTVEQGVKVGSINKQTFDEKLSKNKDNYASFAVVDYLTEHVSGTIKKQIGTFKEIANPYYATILKTAALNNLNNYQRAKISMVDFLQANFPEEIAPTKATRYGFKVAQGRAGLEMLEDGKMASYDVDPYIAASFDHGSAGEQNVMIALLGKFNNTFKSIVTTYNPGFALAFNPQRDFKRTYKNIPNASISGLLKAYKNAWPSAHKFAKGQLDEKTRWMVTEKMIGIPQAAYAYDPNGDEMGIIAKKYGLQNDGSPWERLFFAKPVIAILAKMREIANTFEVISKIAGAEIRERNGETGAILSHNIRNYTGTPNFKVRGTHTGVTNEIFIFSNIMKEGLKSDWQIMTNPKTRSGYWWKTIKVDILPKALMIAAATGLLGTILKDFFDKVSEYDKSNYIIIPLGWYDTEMKSFGMIGANEQDSSGKKAVYFRVPHDETGRLVSMLFWKAMTATTNKENPVQFMGDVLAVGAGQMPNITPAAEIGFNWLQFIAGKNPYDFFRGRTLIDDTTFAAGGIPALTKMLAWTVGEYGLSYFSTYDPAKNTTIETAVQMIPLINRIIKISDYGQIEQQNAIQQESDKQRARELLQEKDVISNYAIKYRKNKTGFDFDAEADNAVRDIIGHEPETEDEENRADNIKQKFRKDIIKSAGNSMFKSVAYATRNKERVQILQGYKAKMSAEAFNQMLDEMLADKLISKDVYSEF